MPVSGLPGMRNRLFVRPDLGLPAAALGADPFLWRARSRQHETLKLVTTFRAFEEHNGHSISPIAGASRNPLARVTTSSLPVNPA